MAEEELQDREFEFQRFMRLLLNAQKYDFLDDRALFNSHTLNQTLSEFCSIIAAHLDAESCTIQLQLYDWNEMCPSTETFHHPDLEDVIRKLADKYHIEPAHYNAFRERRTRWFLSTMTYPYWWRTKGAAILVAANRATPGRKSNNSPWCEILDAVARQHANTGLTDDSKLINAAIISLESGISKEIVQGNIPRIRDRRSIRQTRHYRKLGWIDPLIWTNKGWTTVFRNYYGVPIRIHTRGEVIGILKVENKFKADRDAPDLGPGGEVNDALSKNATVDVIAQLCDALLKRAVAPGATPTTLIDRRQCIATPISLFSLAYLIADLQTATRQPQPPLLRDLIYIPYSDDNRNSEKITSLLPTEHLRRPPIQLLFEKLPTEQTLWECLFGSNAPATLRAGFDEVKDFYDRLNQQCGNSEYPGNYCEDILKILKEFFSAQGWCKNLRVEPAGCFGEGDDLKKLPDFSFRVTVGGAEADRPEFQFLVLVPPTRKEIPGLLSDPSHANHYEAVNAQWLDLTKTFKPCGTYSGEYVYDDSKRLRATDLLLDRWAARTQAFVDSCQLPEFSGDDARKLSWAALEIGKLIEREISYRANRSDDPMPLTAMEFYRIPISGLSFVDDLRQRRDAATSVQLHADFHLKTMVRYMGLQKYVGYGSRVKEYRTFLQRLGERYDGYVRGNLAIWFYLLSLFVTSENRETIDQLHQRSDNETNNEVGLGCCLSAFRKKIEEAIRGKKLRGSFESADALIRALQLPIRVNTGNPLLGDLKFDSPPLECSPDRLDQGLQALLRNLNREGDRLLPDGGCREFKFGTTANALTEFIELYDDQLDALVLRNYEDYVRCGSSLLIQFLNLKGHGPAATDFCTACHILRAELCTSPRQVEDDPNFFALKDVFDHPRHGGDARGDDNSAALQVRQGWLELLNILSACSTNEVAKVWGTEERHKCALTPVSIYKRLRTLSNILRRQRSAASLDWELGRFDLVGARLNCILKGQVFTGYERVWGRGDPFFTANDEAESANCFAMSLKDALKSRRRMRWLCIRTKVEQGGYNALQIAALMDPEAFRHGHWDRDGLNLLRIRAILGHLAEDYDKTFYDHYRNFAFHRVQWLHKYKDWHQISAAIEQVAAGQPVHNFEKRKTRSQYFGTFPGEGPINALLFLLPRARRQTSVIRFKPSDHAEQLKEIVRLIVELCQQALRYTDKFLLGLTSNDLKTSDLHRDSENLLQRNTVLELYAVTIKLLGKLGKDPNIGGLANNLENESKLFKKLLENTKTPGPPEDSVPLLYLPRTTAQYDVEGELRLMEKTLENWPETPDQLDDDGFWYPIVLRLERVRMLQKSYFEHNGKRNNEGKAGLWLRGQDQVLGRIKNLVFLFDREAFIRKLNDKDAKVHDEDIHSFKSLTSYDLFYYLRSLIPIEIQIRTKLADTVADQYHDGVYKGQPPKETILERLRLEQTGEAVDDIDRELEVNYNDYVVKYWSNRPV